MLSRMTSLELLLRDIANDMPCIIHASRRLQHHFASRIASERYLMSDERRKLVMAMSRLPSGHHRTSACCLFYYPLRNNTPEIQYSMPQNRKTLAERSIQNAEGLLPRRLSYLPRAPRIMPGNICPPYFSGMPAITWMRIAVCRSTVLSPERGRRERDA